MGIVEKSEEIKVLHIDGANEWRGGQQQVVYLVEGLIESGVASKLICRPDSPLWEYSIKNKLPHHPLSIRGEFDFGAAFTLARLIKKEKFNIVHTHTAHDLTTALWAKLIYPDFKLIGARRVDFSVNKSFLSLKKYNNHLVNRIVCVSHNVKNILLNDGIPANKLNVVHDGIDLNRFKNITITKSVKEELEIPENSFLVGTIAALVDHKDYPTLLRAAQTVIKKNKQVFFIAAGDGLLKYKLHALSRELGIEKQFQFLGFRTDVLQILKQMDIFVLSSKEEGLGSSVLDAQACAIPVVATQGGGIPEIINHEINGLLAPVEDDKTLASLILDLIQSPEKRKLLATNGSQSVKNYSVQHTVENTEQIYKDVLSTT